ncbi:response regulator receiver modulated diguanylate cyclase [Stanieria cyanosphaera PCC 7437]|uniref:histidine kinase n=1 Tax=Stanieria cyanosphaera (strain ATCC 29371 / PCC 7437) TaxID=111780 RepID=K9XRM7_STAC7|nr:diguanylate cyclase [Stanieria cyanosphaera]AFZ35168.1 response regulator receiver modulated diguanylate cyclase [Stanieria cyanosphaera PCC 7437]
MKAKPKLIQEEILVVDDQRDNLLLLSTMLTMEGYQVREVVNGKLALQVAKADQPDLILLDINMPEMNGYEVCQLLKADQETKDIPIIFISASHYALDKVKAFNCGGNDYITKPFQLEEVSVRIKNQLAIRRLQVELTEKNACLENEIRHRQEVESELLKLNQQLKVLATVDSLTKIANRYYFDEMFEREWRQSNREKSSLSLILCDVDFFKSYNDYFGHQAGDDCLYQVAQAISEVVKRPMDLVARYGGEEFVVLLPQTPVASALELAEKIRYKVYKLNLHHPLSATSDRVSLSLGVAGIVASSQYNKEQFLAIADQALYQAKQLGRNRVILGSLS